MPTCRWLPSRQSAVRSGRRVWSPGGYHLPTAWGSAQHGGYGCREGYELLYQLAALWCIYCCSLTTGLLPGFQVSKATPLLIKGTCCGGALDQPYSPPSIKSLHED
ncbi:hypothetical protein EJ06DRAFT_13914 [Trichodelitschia bisporula]|uniref:Uncharacterized protein n=1 Tax=Trichodelitschia bisporula TaxID=703511 RepID=A0A6G1IAQ6_9PEZI|nr:hypothetical protein EJ06DRAFT_13914 [Trichodelitschia bisporula]